MTTQSFMNDNALFQEFLNQESASVESNIKTTPVAKTGVVPPVTHEKVQPKEVNVFNSKINHSNMSGNYGSFVREYQKFGKGKKSDEKMVERFKRMQSLFGKLRKKETTLKGGEVRLQSFNSSKPCKAVVSAIASKKKNKKKNRRRGRFSQEDDEDLEAPTLTEAALKAGGKFKGGERMGHFMDKLYSVPDALERSKVNNPAANVAVRRSVDPNITQTTATCEIVRCAGWSTRNSTFISRTGEWSGTMRIPFHEEYINSVMMGYMFVGHVPDLVVFAVLEHNVNIVDGYVQVSFQLVEEDGGSMPMPDSPKGKIDNNQVTVRIVSKVRDIVRNNFLQKRNPDDTWNSDAVNTLIDLMKKDRRESLVRKVYLSEDFGQQTAMDAVEIDIASGDYGELKVFNSAWGADDNSDSVSSSSDDNEFDSEDEE